MKRSSLGRLLLAGLVVLSLGAVAGGFLIIGSPEHQRLLALDRKRISDLRAISYAVNSHWDKSGNLPAHLDNTSDTWARSRVDPVTAEPYRYEVIGVKSFRLCADFALGEDDSARDPWAGRFPTHGKGLQCFDFKVGHPIPVLVPPS